MNLPYPRRSRPSPAHRPPSTATPSGAPRPRLTFLGTGYLGATYAICFAELGYEVLGFDVDAHEDRQAGRAARCRSTSPAWTRCCAATSAAGRLRFTTDYAEAADFGDVHFICVGTPQRADGMGADLTYVETAVTIAGAAPDPQGPDRRQVDRAGRHRRVGRAAGRQARPGRRWASRSPGARSSCRRASRSRTCCAPTGSCSA